VLSSKPSAKAAKFSAGAKSARCLPIVYSYYPLFRLLVNVKDDAIRFGFVMQHHDYKGKRYHVQDSVNNGPETENG
jgi:hypothetical protein